MRATQLPLLNQFAIAAVSIIALVGVSAVFQFGAIHGLWSEAEQTRHDEEIVAQAQTGESLVLQLAAAERGFVITGSSQYLERWRQARAELPAAVDKLRSLVGRAPERSLVDEIETAYRDYVNWSGRLVAVAQTDRAAASPLIATSAGLRRSGSVSGVFQKLVDRAERQERAHRAEAAEAHRHAVTVGVASLVALIVLVAPMLVYFVRLTGVPLIRLAAGTRRLAAGETGVQVPEAGAGEVRLVTRAFNEMSAALDESRTGLEQRQVELRAVLDAATSGMLMTDIAGNVLFANRAMDDIWDSLHIGARGPIWERVAALARHTGDLERYAQEFGRIAEDPMATFSDEFRVLDARRDFSGRTEPVVDANGEPLGRIFILREITRERESERLKDEFVATVSHELRTPLTSIRGFLELVLEGEAGDLTSQQRRFLSVVDRNSERLMQLVGDLLLLAQLDAHTLRLEAEDVPLADVAAEAVEAARPAADFAKLELDFRREGEPTLRGDRRRLAQVIDNLLSNAIKFTPAGGTVAVTVRVRGAEACVEVSDTGPGMTEAEASRLFERFYRTSSASTQQIQGTGLGLTITRAIVELHGGTIRVQSEQGKGTAVTVLLPMERA